MSDSAFAPPYKTPLIVGFLSSPGRNEFDSGDFLEKNNLGIKIATINHKHIQ